LILSLCTITVFSFDEVKVTNLKEVFQLRRKASECAIENEKALSCGSKKGKPSCCPGLVCNRHQDWRCVKPENVICAGEKTIAIECGAMWNKAAPKCCANLKCVDRFCMPATVVDEVLEQMTDKPTLPPTLPPKLPPTMSPTKKTTYRVNVKVECLYDVCQLDELNTDEKSDPYVIVRVGSKEYKTATKEGIKYKGCWNNNYDFGFQDLDKYGKINVEFEVWDDDKNKKVGHDFIGQLSESTSETTSGQKKLNSKGSKEEKKCGRTQLSYTISVHSSEWNK